MKLRRSPYMRHLGIEIDMVHCELVEDLVPGTSKVQSYCRKLTWDTTVKNISIIKKYLTASCWTN